MSTVRDNDASCGENGFPVEKLGVNLPLMQSRLGRRHAWQEETGASQEAMMEMSKKLDLLLPIAKEWFLWLVQQRVPVALQRQECGLVLTAPVLKVDYRRNIDLPFQVALKGGSGGDRQGEPIHQRMARHVLYSVALSKGTERLGPLMKHFEEAPFQPEEGGWPSEINSRLNVLREAAEVKMLEGGEGVTREVYLAFEERRVQLIRAIYSMMERIPDWVVGYQLESKAQSVGFKFHAAPARRALNTYPMGIELSCRGGGRLIWWTRQSGRKEVELGSALHDAEGFTEMLLGCVTVMLVKSVPDASVALGDLQAGLEAGVMPLTGVRKKDLICIKVNGTQVTGRISELEFSSMTVEILQPYQNMRQSYQMNKPLYPFRGFLKSDIREEVTPLGIEQSRRSLANLYEGCRLIEENETWLRDQLKAAEALEAQRRAALPSPQEWSRRKSEIKARRERGELDACEFQKAIVFLKHERQMLEDDVARPMNDYAIEVRRVLGSSCDELCIMDFLNKRVYLTSHRRLELGEEPPMVDADV